MQINLVKCTYHNVFAQLQPRPDVWSVQRGWLYLVLQLLLVQQEAETHRVLHLQSCQVSFTLLIIIYSRDDSVSITWDHWVQGPSFDLLLREFFFFSTLKSFHSNLQSHENWKCNIFVNPEMVYYAYYQRLCSWCSFSGKVFVWA